MSSASATSVRPTTAADEIQTLNVVKNELIDAPLEIVWDAILEEMGPANAKGNGTPMPMTVEPWPGGRWFRDTGNNTGHLWGHVQVIKPPKLLEICGPLFMSYPAVSHMQYRLTEDDGQTRVKLTHRAIGLIDPEHARGVNEGWQEVLDTVRRIAMKRKSAR